MRMSAVVGVSILVGVIFAALLAAAAVIVVAVNLFGFMRHSWRNATPRGRGVGVVVGLSGARFLTVRSLANHNLWELALSAPGAVVWSGLAMKLTSWFARRRNVAAKPEDK